MLTLDKFIKNYKNCRPLQLFDVRADEILASLSGQLESGLYLTERQAILAVDLLTKNRNKLTIDEKLLTSPQWDKPFRIINRPQHVKFITGSDPNKVYIEIAYRPDKKSSKKFEDLRKKLITQPVIKIKKSIWQVAYTENILYDIVEFAMDEKIIIDPKIMEIFEQIHQIKMAGDDDLIYIEKTTNDHLLKKVIDEVGTIDSRNLLLEDRKIAFQYKISDSFYEKKTEKTLIEKIATRKKTRIFLSKTIYQLDQIINTITKLKRLPLLVIFDSTPEKSLKNLKLLSAALEENNLTDNVGIYFRYENSEIGKPFNEFIAQKAYNKQLNNLTEVVGITNVKIPKFLFKNKWQPKSVLILCQTLGSNRVNLYTAYCDLVIYYQDKKPFSTSVEEIV